MIAYMRVMKVSFTHPPRMKNTTGYSFKCLNAKCHPVKRSKPTDWHVKVHLHLLIWSLLLSEASVGKIGYKCTSKSVFEAVGPDSGRVRPCPHTETAFCPGTIFFENGLQSTKIWLCRITPGNFAFPCRQDYLTAFKFFLLSLFGLYLARGRWTILCPAYVLHRIHPAFRSHLY